MASNNRSYRNDDGPKPNIPKWIIENNNFSSFELFVRGFLAYFVSITQEEIGQIRNKHDWELSILEDDGLRIEDPVIQKVIRKVAGQKNPFQLVELKAVICIEDEKHYLGKLLMEAKLPEDPALPAELWVKQFQYANVVSSIGDEFFRRGYLQPPKQTCYVHLAL